VRLDCASQSRLRNEIICAGTSALWLEGEGTASALSAKLCADVADTVHWLKRYATFAALKPWHNSRRMISHRLSDVIRCNVAGLSLWQSAQHGLASLCANACCRERFPIWWAERFSNGVS
jgi:hypothetical protein